MSARTVRRICFVGFADLAYRVFLRGFVRRQIGLEPTAAVVGSTRQP